MQSPVYQPKHELSTLFISSFGRLIYENNNTIVLGVGQLAPRWSPKWENALKSKDFAETVLYFVAI